MKIFVTSYTYIYEHAYKVFDYFKNREDLVFVLPGKWKSTKGLKITAYPRLGNEFKILTTPALFYHSQYPLVRGLLKGWMPLMGKILREHARQGDVFYSSYEPNLLVTYLYARLAKKLGLKHVFFTWQNVSYHQRLSGLKLKITQWLLKENFRLSAGGLFGMKRAYEIHEPYFKYNPNLKVDIIPQTGVDLEVFNYQMRAKSDFRSQHVLEDKLLFLFAATFTERKGVIPTVKAFTRVAEEYPRAHLVMIGTGNLKEKIIQMIGAAGLSDRVTILPWQPINELAPIYAAADVFVHPSEPYQGWEEQFGLLMLQAQACGTPVISSRTGSLEETVLDQKTGILVEPGNWPALAQAMRDLAGNEGLRKTMGQNASQYILDHFSNQSVAGRLENYLRSL